MNIDLNLDDVYDINIINTDLTAFTFVSLLKDGSSIEIAVVIQHANNPFLQEFLNLAFGPEKTTPQGDVYIDDFAKVEHVNYSKAFSTVLFCAVTYLRSNPGVYIGIDGSDFRRAYLYFRIIQRNYDYLMEYFFMYGIKYWARVLRGGNKNEPMSVDTNELANIPYKIENQPLNNHKSLFNYFLFYLI